MTSPEDTATFASGEKARQVLFDEIDKVLDRVKSVKKKITRTELPIAMPMTSFVRDNTQDEFDPVVTPVTMKQPNDADYIPPPTPIQFDHILGTSSQDGDDDGQSTPQHNVNLGTPIMSTLPLNTTSSNTTSDPIAKIIPIAVTLSKRRKEKYQKDVGNDVIAEKRSLQMVPLVEEGNEPDKGTATVCDVQDDSCSDCSKSNTDVGPAVLQTDDGLLSESNDDGTQQTLETDSTDTPAASALTEASKSKIKVELLFNMSKYQQDTPPLDRHRRTDHHPESLVEQKAEPSPLTQSQQQKHQQQQPRSYSHALQHTPPSLNARRTLTSVAVRTPPPSASKTTAIAAVAAVTANTTLLSSHPRSSVSAAVESAHIVSWPALTDRPNSVTSSSANSSESEDHAGPMDQQTASASASSSTPSTAQFPVVVGRKRKTQPLIPKPASLSSEQHNPTSSSTSSSSATGIAFPSPVRTSSTQVLMDVLMGSNRTAIPGTAGGSAYEYNSPLRSAAGNDQKNSNNSNNINNDTSNGVSVMTYSPQKGSAPPKSTGKMPVLRAVSFSLNSHDDDEHDDDDVQKLSSTPGIGVMTSCNVTVEQQLASSPRTHGNGSGTSKNSNSNAANNSSGHSKPSGKGNNSNGVDKGQQPPLPKRGVVPPSSSSGSGGHKDIDDLYNHVTASLKKGKSKKSSAYSWSVVFGQALLLLVLSSAGLLFAGIVGPRPGAWLAQLYLGEAFYPITAAELRALSISPPTTPLQLSKSVAAERWRTQTMHRGTNNGDFFERPASSDVNESTTLNDNQHGQQRLVRIEVELKALADSGLFSKTQRNDDTTLAAAVDQATKVETDQDAEKSLARYDDYLAALPSTDSVAAAALVLDHTSSEESAPTLAAEVVAAIVPILSPELHMTMQLPMQGRPTLSGEVAWEFSGHLLSDLYHRRSSMRIVLDVSLDGRKLNFPTGDRVDIGVADGRSIKLMFRLEEHGILPGVHEVSVRAVFVVPLPDSDAAVSVDRATTRIGEDCFGMGFRRCRAYVLPESIVQFYYVPLDHPRYRQEIEEFRAVVEERRHRYEKAMAPSLDDNRKSSRPDVEVVASPVSATATAPADATTVLPDDITSSMLPTAVSVTAGIATSSSTATTDKTSLSSSTDNHHGTFNVNNSSSSSSSSSSTIRGHQGGQGHLFAAKGLAILSPDAETRLTMPADAQGRNNAGAAPLAVVQLLISLPRRLCLTTTATGGEGKWSLRSGTLRLQIEHNLLEGSDGRKNSKHVYDTTQIALEHFDRAETLPDDDADHSITVATGTTTDMGDSRNTTDTGGNFVVIIDMRGMTLGTHAITAAIVVVEPSGVKDATPLDGNTVLYSDAVRFFIQE